MAKKESSFINMTLTLILVTGIAAAALGFVHDFTEDPIAAAKAKAQTEAIKAVLPEFDKLGDAVKVTPPEGGEELEFFPAYKGDELVGTAIKTYTNLGFSGHFVVMAGIDKDGNFSGYSVLEHEETPGLGAKMVSWFNDSSKPKQNVIGKNPETTDFHVSKDGGDVDAITASTITSRAFLDAMRRAYETYKKQEEK